MNFLNILKSAALKEHQDEVADVIFGRGKIKLYDLKTFFSTTIPDPNIIERTNISEKHSFEILDTCDDDNRFVIHPNTRLQKTSNGGTVKILRLEKGYKISQHFTDNKKGNSYDTGVNVLGTNIKLAIDKNRQSEFKFDLGKLTHEHLVMIIDSHLHKRFFKNKNDKAKIKIQYLIIDKVDEIDLVKAIRFAKRGGY